MNPIFLALTLFAVWSSAFPLSKALLEFTSPLFLTALRMVVSGGILLSFLAIRSPKDLKIKKEHFLPLLLLSFFNIYLTNVLEAWGLQYLSSSKTCFIYSLSPFFSAILSYLYFSEQMTLKKWVGIAIGILGTLPVFAIKTSLEKISFLGLFSIPSLAVVIATLASVYGWVLLRLLVKPSKNSITPLSANGFSMLFGGLFAFLHAFFVGEINFSKISSDVSSFIFLFSSLVLISHIICYNFYGYLLKRYTATFLTFIGLFSPFFASIYGYLFLGEMFSWIYFVSTSILLFGLWIIYAEEIKQGYMRKELALKKE